MTRGIEWVEQGRVGHMSRWVCPLTRVGSVRDGYLTFPIIDPTMV